MASAPRPLFIFSLPRSGSTLLQRALAAHSEVSTVSEPWILLPLLYARRDDGIYAEYDHGLAKGAIDDFVVTLPKGGGDYDAAVRAFAEQLYARAGAGATYFVDKTPRYHLVVDDVLRVFPDAKVVFLWRNPLAVAASIMNTYAEGRWNLYLSKVDLFDGLTRLVAAFGAHRQRVHAMRYEDLVASPAPELRKLNDYLGLTWEDAMLTDLGGIELLGRLGDKRRSVVMAEPAGHWHGAFATPLRQRWARRYLRWIGAPRLATMGYDLDALLSELAHVPARRDGQLQDALRMLYGVVWSGFEPVLVRDKVKRLRDWRGIHAHP